MLMTTFIPPQEHRSSHVKILEFDQLDITPSFKWCWRLLFPHFQHLSPIHVLNHRTLVSHTVKVIQPKAVTQPINMKFPRCLSSEAGQGVVSQLGCARYAHQVFDVGSGNNVSLLEEFGR